MLDGKDFVSIVKDYRERLGFKQTSSDSELAAFTAYAQAFPDVFLALVDTYDTMQSGMPNFLCVALALDDLGHRSVVGYSNGRKRAHASRSGVAACWRFCLGGFEVLFPLQGDR